VVAIGNQLGSGANIHSFVTSTKQLHVSWTGFEDLEAAELLSVRVSVQKTCHLISLLRLS
jgi:hypothetical protein